MDDVPLRMPQAAPLQGVKDDATVTVPNYFSILQETEYEFSLENWVVTGLQSCFAAQHQPEPSSCSSGQLPSCPPYWMILSSPQQNRLASRQSSHWWEPNPPQRSHSLKRVPLCTEPTISDSEDEEATAHKSKTSSTATVCLGERRPQRGAQKAFVPDLLNPPACLSSLPHQRRKNLRQCSLSLLDTDHLSQSPPSHTAPSTRPPHTTASRVDGTLRPDACRNPPTSPPRGLPSSGSDSTAELLSALSPEERELLGAITARGYSLHAAITALQRTGRQTPDQILRYLVACEHLCQLGYDMAQVEEALEMFQNCEAKAEEFLHLLGQFNEMGFQKNAIKEVLLVHENHRDRALEELMMRVS